MTVSVLKPCEAGEAPAVVGGSGAPPNTSHSRAADAGADNSGARAAEASISARVRAQQLQALDATALSGAANLPAVILAAFLMRNSVDAIALCLWVAACAGVVAGLVAAVRCSPRANATSESRLAVRVFFAAALGCVWGAGCLAFGARLAPGE